MKKSTFIEAEQRRMQKLQQFKLAHHYKKIGYIIAFASVGLMFAKILFDEPEWVKELLRNTLLLGMLIISISKEKIEDEYIESLRASSYRISFVLGVAYALVQPYINYLVASLIRPEKATLDFSYFQVLTFMLLIQLMYFAMLKKIG